MRNVITCGVGNTRRDDGGKLDNDADGYEPCASLACVRRAFVRGNANDDATVNLSDALYLLSFLFLGGQPLNCELSGDTSGDGTLNLSDAVHLLDHLFRGGPPPAPPYPACGFEGVLDSLGCLEAESCEEED